MPGGSVAGARVSERFDVYLQWLQDFLAVPSVSATRSGLEEAVSFLEQRVAELGGAVEILRLEGAHPAVIISFAADRGPADQAPTLLFYDHYDVQPPEPLDEWESPPFSARISDGKIYARGVSDNKGDIISRLAAVDLAKRRGGLACNVKFLIEGEEEIGSPNLGRYVEAFRERLQADACIWEAGSRDPGERLELYLGLKGIAYVELSVKVADVDLHSSYGAIVDAASNRLVRALATLRDENGKVCIPGFYDYVVAPSARVRQAVEAIPFESEKYRKSFGVKRFIRGREDQAALAALLLEPTCTVCGVHSGYGGEGAKTVLPKEARAKIDFRLVPNQSPERVVERLRHHLRMEGFGDVEVRVIAAEHPYRTEIDSDFVDLVASVAKKTTEREISLFPSHPGSGPMHPIGTTLGVPIVSLGVGYWDSRPHAPNENIRLADFEECIALFADLFEAYGTAGATVRP